MSSGSAYSFVFSENHFIINCICNSVSDHMVARVEALVDLLKRGGLVAFHRLSPKQDGQKKAEMASMRVNLTNENECG